ncbi:hypothetical protein QY884_06060 [Latilactobacillus sakei]
MEAAAVIWLGYALYQFVRHHSGQDEVDDTSQNQALLDSAQVKYRYITASSF